MKSKNLFFAMAAGMMLFTACSSEEDMPNGGDLNNENGKQLIALSVANDNSLATRAGRPLESSAPGQSIENVKIILTDASGNIKWTKLITDWDDTGANDYTNGREATIEIPKTEFTLENETTYNLYAYGYSNDSEYGLTTITGAAKDGKFTANQTIALSNGFGEEIFAGDATITGNTKGVKKELVLNRQVAGTFGYMCEIPYVKDAQNHEGKFLRLVASNPQNSLVLGKYADTDHNNNSGAVFSVVNGTVDKAEHVVYTINLEDWFTNIEEGTKTEGDKTVGTGVIAAGDNWKGDDKKFENGSVFAGSFIIPFAKTTGATFQLQLTDDANGTNVLRTWDVTLPTDTYQLSAYTLWSFSGDAWADQSVTDTKNVYNVLRNHLYGIGARPSADPKNPGDGGDDPTPINNKQELVLKVNHNWEVIYNMGVE